MSGAAGQLQAALAAQLQNTGHFEGVYDDSPARAAFPYVVVHCPEEKPWNMCGREGREIKVELTLWDEQPSRLLRLDEELELGLATTPSVTGWWVSSIVKRGRRRLRNPAGPWSSSLELRVRLLIAEVAT